MIGALAGIELYLIGTLLFYIFVGRGGTATKKEIIIDLLWCLGWLPFSIIEIFIRVSEKRGLRKFKKAMALSGKEKGGC